MKRTMRRDELARVLDVSPRTIERWVQNGCPCTRGARGRLLFDAAEVRAWLASSVGPGARGEEEPERPGGVRTAEGGTVISTVEKAELAGKIARARKAEIEVAQEKHLRDLGLGDRIREVHSFADLSRLTAEVAAACAEGSLRPERANALHRLLVERRRQLVKQEAEEAEDPLGTRVLLCTAESEDLVRAFEGLYSEERRHALLRCARELLEADLAEGAPVDMSPAPPPPAPPIPDEELGPEAGAGAAQP